MRLGLVAQRLSRFDRRSRFPTGWHPARAF